MEPKFKTSFIPRKSLEESTAPKKKSGRGGIGMGIGSLASLIIFLTALGGSAGLFLYKQYLETSIDEKRQTLQRAREAFQPALIRELTRLDTRIQAVKSVIDNHVTPSSIFGLLEQVTLENVRYTSLSYSRDESGDVTISMEGQAKNFSAVALQSDAYGEEGFILEPIVSDLDLDDSGNVKFKIRTTLDPRLVAFSSNLPLYQELLSGQEASARVPDLTESTQSESSMTGGESDGVDEALDAELESLEAEIDAINETL